MRSRRKHSTGWLRRDTRSRRRNYVDLADYEKIIEKNSQEVFDLEVFTAPGQKGNKKQRLAWFARLLRVRNKTAHPERDPVTEEEFGEIRDLDEWLTPRLDDGGARSS